MLKYGNIISKLTDAQKVRLLTSVGTLSGKELKMLGIPTIKIGNVKDYLCDIFPHSAALVHSWDTELCQAVATERLKAMAEDGVNFAVVPGAKIKFSPFRKEISEDPYLAAETSRAYVKAADGLGVVAGVAGCYLTDSDVEWLDDEPDGRVVNEYVVRPYKAAASSERARVIVTDLRSIGDAYVDVVRAAQDSLGADAEFLVCARATDENTVDLISRGVICLDGSANALEAAMTRYRKLKKQVELATVSEEELAEGEAEKSIITDEAVDAALDRTIDLLFRCRIPYGSVKTAPVGREVLSEAAFLESSVLLKNDGGVLPLDKKRKIGVIGYAAFDEESCGDAAKKCARALTERGYKCTGFAAGYSMEAPLDKQLTEEALVLCESSDVIVLFMGFGHAAERLIPRRERLTLPANQLRLAHLLAEKGKQVVAVISTAHAPDVDFTRELDGVLLANAETESGINAAVRILAGEYNPSGKLAYTLYAGSVTAFAKRALYKHKYNVRSGPFVGYRYYDTAGMHVGYPFGHGLSYSVFKYKDLAVKNGSVSFTVENVGDVSGTETAQIYVGVPESAVIRPKKELGAFVRLTLEPGEKKRVTVSPELPSVFYGGDLVLEGGTYAVYVGSSVSDIRLTGEMTVSGQTLEPDGKRLSDHLQSVSNVLEDNYTLEASYKSMKKSVRNILVGVGALALGISVAVFNAVSADPALFLGIIAGILAAVSVVFFVLEAVDRSRTYAEERKEIDRANVELFDGAEEIPFLSTDAMFKEEFDIEEPSELPVEAVEAFVDDDHAAFIDASFTVKRAVEEFGRFAEERGYRLGEGVAENLITSLATSKLIIVSGLASSEFNSVILLLGEYFGNNVYVDVLDHSADSGFLSHDVHGEHEHQNILLALGDAANAPERVQISAFDGVRADNALDVINPFMGYLTSQKEKNEVFIFNEMGVNVGHTVSSNLWIVFNLAAGESVDCLPESVLAAASLVNVSYTKTKPSESVMLTHGFNRYQLEYILEKEAGRDDIPEELWKKVDKLERYAAEISGYRIGNKPWRRFEQQIGLLLAAGVEIAEAADYAIAIKLLPSVSASIRGKLSEDGVGLTEALELVFGEEDIDYCKTVICGFASVAEERRAEAKRDVPNKEEQKKPETVKPEDENKSPASGAFSSLRINSMPITGNDSAPTE